MNFSKNIKKRMNEAINLAWNIFMQKHGNSLFSINKEASMQLQYSLILNQLIPLITLDKKDEFSVELESGISVKGKSREIDLLFISKRKGSEYIIAIEMKCYRDIAASGGKRGATDIFMKDVYEDIALIESYQLNKVKKKNKAFNIDEGYVLVVNDLLRLVEPKVKKGKCWDYDISNGFSLTKSHLKTPIGGKKINIKIEGSYLFSWNKVCDFWYLILKSDVKE
jgi:hypothetical protein